MSKFQRRIRFAWDPARSTQPDEIDEISDMVGSKPVVDRFNFEIYVNVRPAVLRIGTIVQIGTIV